MKKNYETENAIESLNSHKYVVVAKCSDGDVVISRDGEIAFDFYDADEIALDHLDMGAEIEVMQYADYRKMTL